MNLARPAISAAAHDALFKCIQSRLGDASKPSEKFKKSAFSEKAQRKAAFP
jgi:hypothetical protein